MTFSIDLVLVIGNLLLLAYSFGKFSEKIASLEKQIIALTKVIGEMSAVYYLSKDGVKLEGSVAAIWKRIDECEYCHKGHSNE